MGEPRQTFQHTAVVIGAGLAGLSAAVRLIEEGIKPIILEKNVYVGGRTASWMREDFEVETGLHRFLGVYKHLPQLLRKVGIEMQELLSWEDEIEIRTPDGAMATLGFAPFHKPLKTMLGFFGYNNFLTPADKLGVARFFSAGARDYMLHGRQLDSITVLAYARQHGVSQRAIERLLIPLTEGIFFLPIGSYSAYALLGLLMPYWNRLHKMRIGAFRGGMSEVMAKPIAQYIVEHGGELRTDQAVRRIETAGSVFEVSVKHEAPVRGEAVILAASLFSAQRIIEESFTYKWFRPILQMQTMPSVAFQMELTEPSMEADRTTFGPGTCMAAFAEQSRTTFRSSAGRLSVILSPPFAYVHMSAEAILRTVLRDAARLGLNVRRNTVKAFQKVVVPHDFYLLSPGTNVLRPPQHTPVPGFFLAGDYTKQKYLATMEGAVYSGRRAAGLAAKYIHKLSEST